MVFLDTMTMRIQAGHQAGARRRADRADVEPFELRALPRERVEPRRRSLTSVGSECVATQSVDDDEDYAVGRSRLAARQTRRNAGDRGE